MKKWLISTFIASYLGVLGFGLGCHTLGVWTNAHPMMYFVVWDMFCGWSPYNMKLHVIGEGESGKYYELSPGPWGNLVPWGALGRQHYDPWNNHVLQIGMNVLKRTSHEPMAKIYVVEECSMKKWDLPDHIWNARYDEPRDPFNYYRVRTEMTPDGASHKRYISWAQYQNLIAISDNPRLHVESQKNRQMFMVNQVRPGREVMMDNSATATTEDPGMGLAPLGN